MEEKIVYVLTEVVSTAVVKAIRCVEVKARTVVTILIAMGVIALPGAAAYAVEAGASEKVISTESLVPLPENAHYSIFTNLSPVAGETVSINPPVFSWPYCPHPKDSLSDTSIKKFRLQIAYDMEMADKTVDIVTDSNYYNLLTPLKETQCFWRIGYIDIKTEKVQTWSKVRSFTVATDTPKWDRSMLADEAYLKSKAVHPRIWINEKSLPGIRERVQSTPEGRKWLNNQILPRARAAVKAGSWKNPVYGKQGRTLRSYSVGFSSVLWAWVLTGDDSWLQHRPQDALIKMGKLYLENRHHRRDDTDGDLIRWLSIGFDWLYPVMSDENRKQAVKPLAAYSEFLMKRFYWFTGKGGSQYGKDIAKGAPYRAEIISAGMFGKMGHSHGMDNFINGMYGAFAAWEHDPEIRALFNSGINYMLGKVYFNGTSDGYNAGTSYSWGRVLKILPLHMLAQITLPEANFRKNPHFKRNIEWWMWLLPVDLNNSYWADWQPRKGGRGSKWYFRFDHLLQMALFTGDPYSYKYQLEQKGRIGGFTTSILEYYFKRPEPKIFKGSARIFPVEGWSMASTYPPNTKKAYNDGVGIVFKCGPRMNRNHACYDALSFQPFAYGQDLSEHGENKDLNKNYSLRSMAHNSILIDGMSQNQSTTYSHNDNSYFARLIGFRESAKWVYFAGDATNAYPHKKFPRSGKHVFRTYTKKDLSYLKKVRRHIIFMRKKYFIILDDLETSRPAQFTWIYHVPTDTLSQPDKDIPAFEYKMGDVSTLLVHIADPKGLEVMDLRGNERKKNPISGEEFKDRRPTKTDDWHALWISNKNLKKEHKFLSVLYPVKPGESKPTIKRINDLTVEIINGEDRDIISFDKEMKDKATLFVDLEGLEPLPAPDPYK